jgi:transcriptional regulator with XRE-family HTH domain
VPRHDGRPGPYTNAEIAAGVQELGHSCTGQYIGQLKAGRHAPSLELARAIASFFKVPGGYFSDPETASRTDEQLGFLVSLRNAKVTALALRAADLSDEGLATLNEVLDQIRAEEGLPPGQPGG